MQLIIRSAYDNSVVFCTPGCHLFAEGDQVIVSTTFYGQTRVVLWARNDRDAVLGEDIATKLLVVIGNLIMQMVTENKAVQNLDVRSILIAMHQRNANQQIQKESGVN